MDSGLFSTEPIPGADTFAAQHSPDGPAVVALVTDVLGRHDGDPQEDLRELEQSGAEALRYAHAELVGTKRVRVFGRDAVELEGLKGALRVQIRMFYLGHRRFEFRCYDLEREPEWRCGPGLVGFIIEDLPELPTARDTPQVRHLRDTRFGVAFDAPDDSWLSIGPRLAFGGTQSVWTWVKSGRQIDVQTLDLEGVQIQPDQALFADKMTAGQRVVTHQVTFAGQLWEHREINDKDRARDLFVLVRDRVMYCLFVSQPKRDQRLIEAAKKGFGLIPKVPPSRGSDPKHQ